MLYSYLNENRWIVDCPHCNSAEIVDKGDFKCSLCGHEDKVTHPRNKAEITKIMRRRPFVNRNWTPGETLAMLRAENRANGLEID